MKLFYLPEDSFKLSACVSLLWSSYVVGEALANKIALLWSAWSARSTV